MVRISDLVRKDDSPESDKNSLKFSNKQPDSKKQDEHLKLYYNLLEFMKSLWNDLKQNKVINEKEVRDIITKTVKEVRHNHEVFTNLAETYMDSNYPSIHSVNVAFICINMGLGLNYTNEQLIELGIIGLLHDIGMVKIDNEIFNSCKELTIEQLDEIRKHPWYGVKILKQSKGFSPTVRKTIYSSHERIDGTGYPNKIKNGDITELEQIVGLADTFEAMTHPRPYKEHLSPYEAIKNIVEISGGRFNRKILKALLEQITFYPIGYNVLLNTEDKAKVIRISSNSPSRPVVSVFEDKNGKAVSPSKEIDLSKQHFFYIKETLLDASS
ncbi:HD-GYP domain-containing protein [bacterium]|nr:HD-GYP domain-containing protein [bacterium]